MSRIFIDRPVFAWVIAIVIMLAGAFGIRSLSIEQYPDIAPPEVNIHANYPGASAEVLENSVAQVIEQQLTGLDGMIYFQTTSSSSGQVNVTVTFQKGTNPDIAQVQVQNKVQQALPRLPQEVQAQGLTVTKSNPDFLMVIALYDESDRSTSADIGDYLVSHLQEPIGRISGVGDVNVFGSQYAMRIWLDPFKLASYKLMPSDVIAAIKAQNTQVAAGEIGGQPSAATQMLNATVTARSRLTSPDQFKKIIVKTQSDGSKVLLEDVARVELGSESYGFQPRLNGHPGSGIAVMLAPGADALKTAALVRAEVARQSKDLPPGYKFAFPNDSTQYIKLSVREVVQTLFEAVILVVIVMFVFLQSWRAVLIPAIAVPVVLLGTFGVLGIAGYSINTLTLFGMVLSIGLLVDDAIVVVENVERILSEEPDLTPREATIKSMDQVQTALIAIALVLSAVFLPMAFFGGSVGVIYRQFSITIVSSMALSVMVALVLSPAIAANLLKRPGEEEAWLDRKLAAFGAWFNARFFALADRYRNFIRRVIENVRPALIVYAALVTLLVIIFIRLPTSFVPVEDQGALMLQFTLPPGATQARTLAVAKEIEHYFLTTEKKNVATMFMVLGGNQAGSGQNAGRGFLHLVPWDQRPGSANTAEAVAQRAMKHFANLRDASFYALSPPAVRGLGQASGFTMELENSGGLPRDVFKQEMNQVLAQARQDPILTGVRENALKDNPTLHVSVDTAKAGALGLSQSDVDSTLTTAWGGSYVGDFIDRGRVKRVYVQGDAPYRSRPEDLGDWFVRGTSGEMAPFSSFSDVSWGQAPTTLTRFNGLPDYEIQGDAAPGKSTGEAMKHMEQIVAKFPGLAADWSGLSYQERLSGGQAPILYAVSLVVIFLCLAALYESWSVPFSVMLVVPLGLLGAALAVWLRGLSNDVYFQVGLLTTMGLSAKNAILIVEFAEAAQKRGRGAVEAALEGARLRLRPIIMTSLSFMSGVFPLAIATGAGAKSRIAIGTAVIGGMLTATLLSIIFVPMFFVLVRRIFHKRGREQHPEAGGGEQEAPA
ncbi:MAG: efflux RND transporter permease subunit [Alphaproteobacteria bacterium]|nr:efflux RND transporter permease subunit [Alphaproteobacteria bacterium]